MQILCYTAFLAALLFSFLPLMTLAASPEEIKEGLAVKAAGNASQSWLALVDKQQYAEAWEQSSSLMKNTLDVDSWKQIMLHSRELLGVVESREIADERVAKDPKGLPPGDYMVLFYKTAFKNKVNAYELVTLFFENGVWRVVTYQVN